MAWNQHDDEMVSTSIPTCDHLSADTVEKMPEEGHVKDSNGTMLSQDKASSWDAYLRILAAPGVGAESHSTNQTTSFTLFPRLPTELRLCIWRLTFPRNRRISLNLKTLFADKGDYIGDHTAYTYAYDLDNLAAVPIALHVCYESRQETLKHYRVIARPEIYWDKHHHNRRFPFTFNPQLDVAQLEKHAARWGVPAQGHKRGCGLLPPAQSGLMACCDIYLNEGLSCGTWDALLSKYAPGLLGLIQKVYVDGVDWNSHAMIFLEHQMREPQSALLHAFLPKQRQAIRGHLIFGPLLNFTSMTELCLRIDTFQTNSADVAMHFQKFLAVHMEHYPSVNVHTREVDCMRATPTPDCIRREQLEMGLKAIRVEKEVSINNWKRKAVESWAEKRSKRRRKSIIEVKQELRNKKS